jgi:hypothetical protein
MVFGLLALLPHAWWLLQYHLEVRTALQASIESGSGAVVPLLGETLVTWSMARAMTIGSLALVVLGLALLLARPVVLERLGHPSWSQLPARDIAHWVDSMAGPQTVAVVQPIHVAGALALHTSAVRWVAYPGSSKLAIPTDVDACDVLWVSARAPKPGPAIATELGYRAEGALQSYRWHAASSASSGGTLYAQRWVTDAWPCPSLRSVYDRLP